ncbi:hypothetical protein P7C70_g5064, partial [Phenoliferia sp. Uapishka_3]
MQAQINEVCGWTHCRQHIQPRAPGGIHRHYVVRHGGRYPPARGYDSDVDEEVHPDAELHNQVFWAAQEQRRRVVADDEMDGVEGDDGSRVFVEERFPNAGWPCNEAGEWLDDFDTPPREQGLLDDPDEPFAPFDDERQYGWADRISKFRMSKAQVDAHMRRHAEQEPTEPAFTTFDHYRKKVDQIEYGPEWATWRKLVFKAAPEDLPVDAFTLYPFLEDQQVFYYRNTDAVLRDLLRNPAFVGRQSYAPVRHSLPDGPFITEPHTGSKAWAFQETLDVGTTQVRLTLASDGTTCSMASGNASVHPVYLSTSLNDASLIREDRGALVVVGFIPTLKCTKFSRHMVNAQLTPTVFVGKDTATGVREMFARYARQVRHHCMSILMEPLRAILESDQLRQTADGWWRWCRAYLGCQPVDYPEGGWLLSVLKNWVVCCEASPEELGDGVGIARTTASSAAHRALGAEFARSKGLHMEKPFYEKFNIDGHALIISDLLHQLTKGAFKDWTLDTLVKAYLKDAVGGGTPYDRVMKEIARRLEVLPPYSNLRRFKTGIEFSQWTGKDSRALMVVRYPIVLERGFSITDETNDSLSRQQIISSALWGNARDLSWGEEGADTYGTALDEVAQSITLITVIYLYAAGLESTATDREMEDAAIKLYHEVIRYAFEDEREMRGYNWARLHSMFHYVEWTEINGTAPHSDTSHYETAHIRAVKLPYRASNRCNAIVQILRANTRRDCLASLKGRLELSGTIPTSRPMLAPVYLAPLTTLPTRGDRGVRLRLQETADKRNLPGFAAAANAFLATYLNIPGFEYQGKVETHTIASASFPVYGKPAYLSNDTCQVMNQRIYATEDYPYRGEEGSIRGPRYDTVLVQGSRHAELNGESFGAYEVSRARLFFTIRYRGRRVELCLGEAFMKVPNHPACQAILQPVVHPVDIAGEPLFSVFLVADILRTVHLQPLFGKLGVPKDLNFMETLDRWRGSYAVGVFTDQHIFRLLFRPDAARYIRPIPRV